MRIGFYIFYALAWMISLLPFWVLYLLSDFLYFIFYQLTGYRKEVTFTNLRKAFPDKDEEWIKETAKAFYHNLCDIILENMKVLSIRQKNLAKRYRYVNTEILEGMASENKSIILALGHCGNWEWMGNTIGPLYPEIKGYAIVKPLSNPHFDSFINGLRNRFIKDSIIYMKDTLRTMVKRKNIVSMYAFAADQTPSNLKTCYWGEFLNQDTAFFPGMEKIARTLDIGVIFMDLYREKRGHYVGELSLISNDSKSTMENEITEAYIKKLDDAIRKRPDNWLWSHRRWKNTREDAMKE